MELYSGAELIECEINGRPLYLPLLWERGESLLIDCGTRRHAEREIPVALENLGIASLDWLVITHPDGDHCGGSSATKQRHPGMRIACGEMDRELVESPDYLFSFRYDAYRADHGIQFDAQTANEIRSCSGKPQTVNITFCGGEVIRLGESRTLEVWALPGHSHGHIGVFDRRSGTLFYGDAIQGKGYRALDGSWALCPTYLYVEPYLQTIQAIERSGAQTIVGCHWPVLGGTTAIRQFCQESRNFVRLADRLISEYLRARPKGATLRELCEELSVDLGKWPENTCLELANAFSGHLDRGLRMGRFEVDKSSWPFVYAPRGSSV